MLLKKEVVQYLLEEHYDPYERPLDACHPRDLVEQVIDISRFNYIAPMVSSFIFHGLLDGLE